MLGILGLDELTERVYRELIHLGPSSVDALALRTVSADRWRSARAVAGHPLYRRLSDEEWVHTTPHDLLALFRCITHSLTHSLMIDRSMDGSLTVCV